jgi:hypothetical protein
LVVCGQRAYARVEPTNAFSRNKENPPEGGFFY